MTQPYVFIEGKPDCEHRSVQQSTLTVIPPIAEWRCTDCGRVVRQRGDNPEPVRMPDVSAKPR